MVEPDNLKDLEPADVLSDLAEEGADPLGLGRPFKDRLSRADWYALEQRGQRMQYLAGAIVCHEGDAGDELHILLSGRVAILKQKQDGQSALLAYRGPGDIVGELGVMSQVPRSATIVAVEDTEMLCLSGEDFRALSNTVPGICRAMLRVLSERLRAADVARTAVIQEERNLARQLQIRTTEAERLAELARLRQQTVDLIVHDLRSPLGVIRGCLDMLQETMSPESLAATSDMLGIARRSTQRLLDLVEALLEAARREVLGIQPDAEPLDLAQLLRTAVDGLRAAATASDIELKLDVQTGLPRLSGDRDQLERVAANLVDNAISYTPRGGQVTITAVPEQDQVVVSVVDTGPGIPPEYREHIFERFSRVPGIRGRRKGFGLGLYFCRQVVQAHGGHIWVEAGPGSVGSRFVFALPLGNVEQS